MIFCPWHDLEVDVSLVVVSVSDDLDGVDDLVLRGHTPLDDPRREEHALDLPGALQCVKAAGQFVGAEGDTFCLAASGAKRAVVTVSFASRCYHCLKQWFLASRRGHVGDTVREAVRLVRNPAPFALRLITRWFKVSHIAYLAQLCYCIREGLH